MKKGLITLLISIIVIIQLISCKDTSNPYLINYDYAEKNLYFIEQEIEQVKIKSLDINEIKYKSNEIINYIEELKDSLLEISCGCNSVNQIKDPLDYKISTNYFIGNNIRNCRAKQLKHKIIDYSRFISGKLHNDSLSKKILQRIKTDDKELQKGIIISWESWNFEILPIINSILVLKQIEFEIRSVEYETLICFK